MAGEWLDSVILEVSSTLSISMIFVHPCNAGCFREASLRGRDQHSPHSIPAGFLPRYLSRACQDFFLQAAQHAFDCRHASVELMDLQERGERGKRRREQTSHHCQEGEETVQPAEESKQQDTATVSRVKRQ